MARETIYVVQAFKAGRGQSLKPDTAIPYKSAEGAEGPRKDVCQEE